MNGRRDKVSNLKERLDRLRSIIQTEDFLEGKGLSNEVNIQIFCYDACDEIIVQSFIDGLANDQTLSCRLIERNLYRTFLACCEEIDILDAIPDMEQADGSDFLLEQLHSTIGVSEFIDRIQYAPHKIGDVLMLTGVGDVFPFMRVHTLLESLQPHFHDIPILVMYPGGFDGNYLRLFDELPPNPYYRAFNLL